MYLGRGYYPEVIWEIAAYFSEDFWDIVAYFPEEGRGEDEGGFSMGLGVTIEKSEARAQRREDRRPVRRPAPLCRAYPCASATPLPHVHEFSGSR